jgi:diacylglycerol kinase (ATP)
MFRVEIIVNPKCGPAAVRKANTLMQILQDRGIYVRVRGTRYRGHAEALAGEAAAQSVDRLVVVGGDGTINEAVNGLNGAQVPLAIVPAGTANVLARELRWPRKLARIADAIESGGTRQINLGAVNGRRFVLMASLGLDAEVVAALDAGAKRRFGRLAYVWGAMRRLVLRRPQFVDVVVDGRPMRVAGLIAAKARHYGGGFVAAPRADLARPEFQFLIARRPGRLAHIGYALALVVGGLSRAIGMETRQGVEVRLDSPGGLPIQADGDLVAVTPAKIEILPRALTLLVPKGSRV